MINTMDCISPGLSFTALDLETANTDRSSICQIGIVRFENGQIKDEWQTLVNPNTYFDPICVNAHGLHPEDVKHAPTLSDVWATVNDKLSSTLVASHTSFDRTSITQAARKNKLCEPLCEWIDTARIARRVWEDVSKRGYGLKSLADRFDIKFNHHDALEDARTAGIILTHAAKEAGLDSAQLYALSHRPLNPQVVGTRAPIAPIKADGNPDGPLYGEVVVFTGSLSMVRREAAELAANAGCKVDAGVNKKTTLLVVGTQDISVLCGHNKSSKHRKAEELIKNGQDIRILTESDFQEIIRY